MATLNEVLQHLTGHTNGVPMSLNWTSHFTEIVASREPPAQAFTRANFNPRANWTDRADSNNKFRYTDVQVTVTMNRGGSWVVRGTQDPVLLNHEQGHYNLTWLKARSLCRKLLEAEYDKLVLDVAKTPVNVLTYLRSEYENMFNTAQADVNALNAMYDSPDKGAKDANGIIVANYQSAWDKMIKYSLDNDTDPTLLVAIVGNPRNW